MSVPINSEQGAQVRGPRMNAKPALIVFALVGLFIFGIMYAAQKRNAVPIRSDEQGRVFELKITADNNVDFLQNKPDGLAGLSVSEVVEPDAQTGRQSTIEQDMAAWVEKQQIEKMQRTESMRLQYEKRQIELYEAALASPMLVSGFGPGSERYQERKASMDREVNRQGLIPRAPEIIIPAATHTPDPNKTSVSIDQAQLNALLQSESGRQILKSLGVSPDSMSARTHQSSSNTAGVDRSHDFIGQSAGSDRFTLIEQLKTPGSPYEIKTGALISGTMISAANSDLPGDIVAQISKDVYDSASGQYLLIPKGTKLFGQYDAFTQLGQERLLIVWNRLIFEDGETLDIQGMQGYDQRGLSGFKDRINTHFLRTLGNALLISVVNAAGEEIINQASESDNATFTLNLAQNFAQNSSSAFDDYLRSRLRIKPTIEIRAGYRFNIIVSKDIRFPRPFERGFRSYNTTR